jgi:outer membrane protein TolC/preprotein translocase subunit SecF
VTELRLQDRTLPVLARSAHRQGDDDAALGSLHLHRPGALEPVPLASVAAFEFVNERARIARERMQRAITLEVRHVHLSAQELSQRLGPDLESFAAELPSGHSIGFDGVVVESMEGQEALAANVPLCVLAMVLLLIAQFNALRRPLIVMATIPLMIIGAAPALLLFKANFGFMVILGLYALAGILINNAIVLLDRIDLEATEGRDPLEAVIRASAQRLRPICMATVTTVLGLLPLIFSRDPLFYGMAVALAGGLTVGTVLTLGVVPVAYVVLHGVLRRRTPPPVPALAAALVLLLPLSASAQTFQLPGEPADIDALVASAMAASANLAQADQAVENARAEVRRQQLFRWPALGLQAGASRIGGFENGRIVTPVGAFPIEVQRGRVEFGARLEASLLELGPITSGRIAQGRTEVDAAGLRARGLQLLVRREVEGAWWRYVAARVELEALSPALARAEATLRRLELGLREGVVIPSAVLAARALTARLEEAQALLRLEVEAAAQDLALLCRIPVPGNGWGGTFEQASGPALDVEDAVTLAWSHRPEPAALRAAMDGLEALDAAQRWAQAPSVVPYVSGLIANPVPPVVPPTGEFGTLWEVGLQVRWSPHQARGASHARERTLEARDALDRERQALLDGLQRQVWAAWTGYRAAVRGVEAATEVQRATLAAWEAEEVRLAEGVGLPDEVLAALERIADAERALQRARVRTLEARTEWLFALGGTEAVQPP